jgi:hypothetical protein
VNDLQTPENNGKVFLYRYGAKIHTKIMEKWQPQEGGILKPVTVFDYYEGANFNLIIKKIKVGEDYLPNYDSSSFDAVSCIGTDEEIEKINNSLFGIKEFQDEKNFKSYEELKEKNDKATGQTIHTTSKNAEKSVERVTQPEHSSSNVETEPNGSETIFSGTDEAFFENLQTE